MFLTNKKNIKTTITVVLILLFVAPSLFITYKYWSPLGKKLKINFANKDDKTTSTVSQDQNGNLVIPAQIIKSDLTRFTMDIGTGDIESITAHLKFKQGPKEIKLGLRGSEKDKFFYKPIYQRFLQDCNWGRTEEIGNFLYQKVKKYDNIGQLISSPPDSVLIASYNIQPSILMQKILTSNLDTNNAKSIDIKTGLRSTHTFYVRVDKAPFYFKLSKQDINAYAGEDKYLISISRDGQLIEEKSITDDGFVGTEKLKKDPQSVEFNLTNIEPGIYEVTAKMEGKSDSVITQITTNQSKMVIKNNVFTLFNKPISLYTKTSPVNLTAVHGDAIQTINLNDLISLDLKKAAEKYVFDLEKLVKDKKPTEFYKLETPKTDVTFSNSGYFAFAPEQYFDPEVIHATDLNTVASLDEIDYILTSIPKAKQEGDWLVSEVTFDPKDIKLDENKKLYFSLEMPDLAKYSGELEIDSFTVEVNLKGALSDKFGKKTTPTLIPTNIPNNSTATAVPSPSITPNSKLSPTPSIKTTPSPTTGFVFVVNKSTPIKVLNGGAPAGYAQKYTDLIKASGYTSVTAGNATAEDLKNVTILYPEKAKADVVVIENILKTEYKNITKTIDATSSAIVVNLGAL